MELAGEPRVALVADALVGAVVHVDEKLLPVCAERGCVNGIAVVLAGYVAVVSADHAHGLVVGAVAVFQLVDGCAAGLRQELVAHADAADRLG